LSLRLHLRAALVLWLPCSVVNIGHDYPTNCTVA
jgi:hypothetical protein